MQGKLFQRCTYLLYCSVLSLGGNVNTRRISKPDMGSIFHIKNQWNILVIETIMWNIKIVKIQCFKTSSDTKRTLMHLCFVDKFHPERTGFNMYTEYTQLKLTFLTLHFCIYLSLLGWAHIIFLVMLSARISLILSYCSLAVKETKRGEVRVKGIKVVIFSDPDFNNLPDSQSTLYNLYMCNNG